MASAWGSAWGVSWGNAWGSLGASTSPTAVTVAGGRRSAATSYRYRTIGSERREKERVLAKIARRAQRKVADAIDTEGPQGLVELVRQEVAATVPESVSWLTPAMLDGIVNSIVDYHRAEWARIQEQQDEDDAEFLLLVA